MKCIVCKKSKCRDEIHNYIMRHHLYYDKNSKLKISKSGIDKLNKHEK